MPAILKKQTVPPIPFHKGRSKEHAGKGLKNDVPWGQKNPLNDAEKENIVGAYSTKPVLQISQHLHLTPVTIYELLAVKKLKPFVQYMASRSKQIKDFSPVKRCYFDPG